MKHRTIIDAAGVAALIAPVLFPVGMFLSGMSLVDATRVGLGGAVVVLLHVPLYCRFRKAAGEFDELVRQHEQYEISRMVRNQPS